MTVDSWSVGPCRVANRNFSLAEWREYMGQNIVYRRTCPDLPTGEGAPDH